MRGVTGCLPPARDLSLQAMSDRTSPRTWVLFIVALLAVPPAAMALQQRIDEDTWWHLAVGKYIATHRALPDVDPFSRIGVDEGARWAAYSWLYELGVYGCHSLFGLKGVFFFRYVLAFGTILVVMRFATRHLASAPVALAALGLMIASVLALLSERPWHATIMGTVLTLDVVLRVRDGEPAHHFWWLPLCYVLWANIHIQFVLGLGLLGLAWGVTVLERRRPRAARGRGRAGLLLLGLACAAATLVTPFHIRLYGIIWEYATQTTPLRTVSELMPPNWLQWWNWPLAVLLAWAAFEVGRRRFPLWETALLATGIVFSLRMQRDLWYGCLTAVAVIARCRHAAVPEPIRLSGGALAAAVAAAFAVVRIGWQAVSTPSVDEFQAKEYPAAAVAYVQEHRLPGPLFNDFNWGGYLIWNLPELPVSIDGRTNFYGEERLSRILNAWAARQGWQSTPELVNARVIIAPRTQLLTTVLLESTERWQPVYSDDVAVVFTLR